MDEHATDSCKKRVDIRRNDTVKVMAAGIREKKAASFACFLAMRKCSSST